MTDSIKIMVKDAVNSGTLCQQFINRGIYLNVTALMSPEGLAAAGAVCDEEPVFTSVFIPAMTSQPSSSPSGLPSTAPTMKPISSNSTVVVTSSFIGFLTIILLIGFLRFNSAMAALFLRKKEEKKNHLYNILVVLNKDEEAILENIRHDDIVFYRGTETPDASTPTEWIMNDTNGVLERRFEVQFYDQYDLLGQSGVDEDDLKCKHGVIGDKVVTKEVYVHQPKLLVGMIITVKELRAKVSGSFYHTEDISGKCSESETNKCSESHSIIFGESVKADSNSSMASIVEFGSAPSSPQKRTDSPIFSFRDSLRNQRSMPSPTKDENAGAGSEIKDINTLELANVYDDDMWESEMQAGATEYGLRHEEYHDDSDGSCEALSIELPLDRLSLAASRGRKENTSGDTNRARRRGSAQARHDAEISKENTLVKGNGSQMARNFFGIFGSTPYESSSDSSHRSRSNPLGKGKGMESATSTTSSNDASSDIQNDEQEKLEGRTGWKEFSPPGEESKVSKTRRERQTAPKDRWSTDSIPILSDSDAMSPDTDPQFPRSGKFLPKNKSTKK